MRRPWAGDATESIVTWALLAASGSTARSSRHRVEKNFDEGSIDAYLGRHGFGVVAFLRPEGQPAALLDTWPWVTG